MEICLEISPSSLPLSGILCLDQIPESLVGVLQGLLKEMVTLRAVSLQNCVSDTSDGNCRRNVEGAWRWLLLHCTICCLVPDDAVSQ